MKVKQGLLPPKPDFTFARPPKSKVAFFWRWRIWFEATFAFTVLEPWEKMVLLVIVFISVAFCLATLFKYLPQQIESYNSATLCGSRITTVHMIGVAKNTEAGER
ncbi:uncharacterized protein ARMOST_00469 [Armillaria ostoyae]|uniref:Uncharacterized protein n=1 Tax=Armillaria ostoyae TaxID=47428 RepID=A0A284QL92_ARMOS|nr:uncharacterized protein ARMOST_00469 [Armillaria ostoyae]